MQKRRRQICFHLYFICWNFFINSIIVYVTQVPNISAKQLVWYFNRHRKLIWLSRWECYGTRALIKLGKDKMVSYLSKTFMHSCKRARMQSLFKRPDGLLQNTRARTRTTRFGYGRWGGVSLCQQAAGQTQPGTSVVVAALSCFWIYASSPPQISSRAFL